MPRRNIQFVQDGYYHLYNRGAGRQSICKNDDDFVRLLSLIKRVAQQCRISVIAYCLMPNHYHWLVRQDGPTPASLLPQRVFGSYTRTFNRIHHRSGTLFEDRFEAVPVDSDAYLLRLCRYIHANPVRHGFATALELWPYSNYLDWMGLRQGSLVDHSFVDAYFSDREGYRQSLIEYMTSRKTSDELGIHLLGLEDGEC